ncbi:15509_t:CDS:1, partial [Funneliformis geosporum]
MTKNTHDQLANQLADLSIKQTIGDATAKLGAFATKHSTQLLGVLEEGAKALSKSGIPIVAQVAGIFSFGADRAKDLMVDAKLDSLADAVGSLQDGLNNVNSKVEAQGKALAGAIDGVKSELEGAIQQQGE